MAPLRRILSRTQIRRRVNELAAQLRADYAPTGGRLAAEERPVFVGRLKGAFVFLADLVRQVGIPLQVDFIMVSSYGMGTTSKGEISVLKDVTTDLAGRHVVFVDDIVDSGLTLERVREHLLSRGPASLRVCALLARESALAEGAPIDYLGFPVPEGFVVGYGIDYAEQYRQLPDICVLEGEG
jgi:hypoxanthine phosphoribosyltransferase